MCLVWSCCTLTGEDRPTGGGGGRREGGEEGRGGGGKGKGEEGRGGLSYLRVFKHIISTRHITTVEEANTQSQNAYSSINATQKEHCQVSPCRMVHRGRSSEM